MYTKHPSFQSVLEIHEKREKIIFFHFDTSNYVSKLKTKQCPFYCFHINRSQYLTSRQTHFHLFQLFRIVIVIMMIMMSKLKGEGLDSYNIEYYMPEKF